MEKVIGYLKQNILQFIPLFLVAFIGYFYSSLLTPFFISIVVAYLLNPLLILMEKRISRVFALFVLFGIVIMGVTAGVLFVVPGVINETSNFIKNLPGYIELLQKYSNIDFPYRDKVIEKLNSEMTTIGNTVFSTGYSFVVSGMAIIINLITVPILTFYFLKDKEKIVAFAKLFIPKKYEKNILEVLGKTDARLQGFIKGQFLDFSILAAIITAGLFFLGIKYPLVLGIFAAVFNLIPYLGVTISGIVIALVAFLQYQSIAVVIKVMILFGAAQMFESLIIAPKVIGDAAEVHPLAIVLGMMVFSSAFGVAGIFLAVPGLILIDILMEHTNFRKKGNETKKERKSS